MSRNDFGCGDCSTIRQEEGDKKRGLDVRATRSARSETNFSYAGVVKSECGNHNSHFSNDSMTNTWAAQRARIVHAWMSIWSRLAIVKNSMPAHTSTLVVSSARTVWRAAGRTGTHVPRQRACVSMRKYVEASRSELKSKQQTGRMSRDCFGFLQICLHE